MKYYYKEHLADYEQVKAEGKVSRGEIYGVPGFDDFAAKPYLDAVLPKLEFSAKRPFAYEYGCGTGPGACYLAQRGFKVDASDLIPDAIEIARQEAKKRGLSIHYEVLDIVELPHDGKLYDLIVDSYCLQGIVFKKDRQKVFKAVQARLRTDGFYLVNSAHFDTAAFNPDVVIQDNERDAVYHQYHETQLIDMATNIVYWPFDGDPAEYADALQINGEWYLPSRRHYTQEQLEAELMDAGFRIIPFKFAEKGHCICIRQPN